MKIINLNIDEVKINEDIQIALGYFDGIHLGHKALFNEFNDSLPKAVLTFSKSIKEVLLNHEEKYLTSTLDKKILLKDFDYLIILEVNQDLIQQSKEAFINFLKKNHVKRIICGFDFTFGNMGCGTYQDLTDFDLKVVPKLLINNLKVSTTNIKNFLMNGDILNANLFLDRPYKIEGEIIHGSHLGNKIGFPTINILNKHYFLPKSGVYSGVAQIDGLYYKGMINIGHNPTFNFQEDLRIEMNLFDTDLDLYHKYAKIYFISFIRDEKKFKDVSELILELNKNKECAKMALKEIDYKKLI